MDRSSNVVLYNLYVCLYRASMIKGATRVQKTLALVMCLLPFMSLMMMRSHVRVVIYVVKIMP